ncbi:MAG: thiamine pyrophosphate-dependent dehydrogenase E1 component subunit alpha [Chloroflexota bacterium]|nr:MAG: thiamine pyrophosphate-dependent dehydrogenase E1 component subunit alpha [Chloroflexota bacterium]
MMNPAFTLNPEQYSQDQLKKLFRAMLRIRRFEETVLEEFSKGYFFGTTHTYLGQEANAVGVLDNISAEDIVVSNHRSHGHFLAYGGDMRALFAELMGKPSGVCAGRGGSQHLHWKNFYSNGVLGGTSPIGTGMALAEKFNHREAITILFIGDGALGEGVLYESLNLASLWSAPVLFVLENNRIAQTTPIEHHLAGSIPERFSAFGIETKVLETSDVLIIRSTAARLVTEVRENCSPRGLILNTYRFGPHSKGDDTRPEREIQDIRENHDPISIMTPRLDPEAIKQIQNEVAEQVVDAFQKAKSDSPAT